MRMKSSVLADMRRLQPATARRRVRGLRAPIVLSGTTLAVLGVAVIGHLWYASSYVDATVYTAKDLRGGTICQIIPWTDGRTAVQISHVSRQPADKLWSIVTNH